MWIFYSAVESEVDYKGLVEWVFVENQSDSCVNCLKVSLLVEISAVKKCNSSLMSLMMIRHEPCAATVSEIFFSFSKFECGAYTVLKNLSEWFRVGLWERIFNFRSFSE